MFQNDDFVEVYSKTTGEKQMVPRAWLGNEVLGADFEITPSGREATRLAEGPSTDWTLKQLQEHADSLGVDHNGMRSKTEVLDAITAAAGSGPSDPSGEPDENPTDPADGQ